MGKNGASYQMRDDTIFLHIVNIIDIDGGPNTFVRMISDGNCSKVLDHTHWLLQINHLVLYLHGFLFDLLCFLFFIFNTILFLHFNLNRQLFISVVYLRTFLGFVLGW